MSSPSVQVLIVGSGPAGLVLALALLQNGISVRIIEKNIEHQNSERGAGVMPRTLEIEHFLGVREVQRRGLGSPRMNIFDPKDPYRIAKSFEVLEKVEPTPAFPITGGSMIGQWLHQQILREHLEAFGCYVELGCALTGLEQHEDGVTVQLLKTKGDQQAEETATFTYLVGADGARSTVRKSLGVNFVGESRDLRIYLVDAVIEGMPAEGKDFYRWGDGRFKVASLRYTVRPGVFQVVLAGENVDFGALNTGSVEAVQSALHMLSGRTDLKIVQVISHGEWRPNMRIADRFRDGRVFIVGDAAHVHAPSGGQGLNTSIQDSFNLAWKLALCLKGHSPSSLLDSYESERLPVIAEMLNITTELFNKVAPQTMNAKRALEAAQSQPAAAKDLDKEGWTRDRKLMQLDLNYRWSEIAFDERFANDVESNAGERKAYGVEGHDICAGDRAPDAPGLIHVAQGTDVKASGQPVTRLFDVFKPSVHTFLIFTPNLSTSAALALLAPPAKIPKDLIQTVVILPSGTSEPPFGNLPIDLDYVQVFHDGEGHAYKGFELGADTKEPTVVIVRPDAMVGAFVTSAEGVAKYTKLIFGD